MVPPPRPVSTNRLSLKLASTLELIDPVPTRTGKIGRGAATVVLRLKDPNEAEAEPDPVRVVVLVPSGEVTDCEKNGCMTLPIEEPRIMLMSGRVVQKPSVPHA